MKFIMAEETRVGFKSTSFLEEMCLEYIRAYTTNGKFTGDLRYLAVYDSLKKYNR
jgi:hypothetical protein